MAGTDEIETDREAPGKAVLAGMLVLFVAWSFSAGLVGGYLVRDSDPSWYERLAKPFFGPPDWVFGPAWSVLYLLMGVAAWLVWRKRGAGIEMLLFAIQWGLNSLWTPIFFVMQSRGFAFLEIIVLWIAVLVTLLAFWRAFRAAGYLMVPYLLWVTFAAVLNGTIWYLNLPVVPTQPF